MHEENVACVVANSSPVSVHVLIIYISDFLTRGWSNPIYSIFF